MKKNEISSRHDTDLMSVLTPDFPAGGIPHAGHNGIAGSKHGNIVLSIDDVDIDCV